MPINKNDSENTGQFNQNTPELNSENIVQAASDNSDFDIEQITPLYPEWLERVFTTSFDNLPQDTNPYSDAEEYKNITLQQMLDSFCSLDVERYNETFKDFLIITDLERYWPSVPDDMAPQVIQKRIQFVPELNTLYQAVNIGANYGNLFDPAVIKQDIDDFRDRYLELSQQLSPYIFANLEYKTAQLYNGLKNNDNTISLTPLYYNVLHNSDDPKAIHDSFHHLNFARICNQVALDSCNRILDDDNIEKSASDYFYLYKTMGDAHSRNKHKIGFIIPSQKAKMDAHNCTAAEYYEKALPYAPTEYDKIATLKRIYVTDVNKYNRYMKKYPASLMESTFSKPYGQQSHYVTDYNGR